VALDQIQLATCVVVSAAVPLVLSRTSLSKTAIVVLTVFIATSTTHLVSIVKDTDDERGALYSVGLMTFIFISMVIAAAVAAIFRRKGRPE
jgi:uncharacterized protein involved in response to NO